MQADHLKTGFFVLSPVTDIFHWAQFNNLLQTTYRFNRKNVTIFTCKIFFQIIYIHWKIGEGINFRPDALYEPRNSYWHSNLLETSFVILLKPHPNWSVSRYCIFHYLNCRIACLNAMSHGFHDGWSPISGSNPVFRSGVPVRCAWFSLEMYEDSHLKRLSLEMKTFWKGHARAPWY